LCDVACEAVAAVCDPAGVGWSTRELSELDDAGRSRWADYVPVVTVDGTVHDVFRVDRDRLRDAIAG
jgi:thiamine monophosphate synthase